MTPRFPRPAQRAARTLVALGVVVATMTASAACSERRTEPNEVDDARLSALQDALPVDGNVLTSPAEGAFRSVNVLAYRAEVTVETPLAQLVPGIEDDDRFARVLPASTALLAALRDAGWSPVMVSCDVPVSTSGAGAIERARIVATRSVDDFVAAAEASIDEDDASVSLYAPFHTEADDPWSSEPWSFEALAGATCLDGPPPDESTSTGTVPENLSLGDVPR